MPYATDSALTLFKYVGQLLDQFWDKKPVRRVGVALSKLSNGDSVQLDLFDHQQQQDDRQLGKTAMLRASSLLPAGQAMERSAKIGGHYK